ncbi:dynactin subunit 2-like [Argiope bruennichi]|uniref:Dynactin subunit 2 like protein n=1 Tax=Argiope bruennichi TaxID=94029 RepID=A0A8T0G0B3_ARGBR|nr:dynactin subunit 2-like [Argiope bruennichi]KAF8796366.1 Dynactin subunit 2 like protein [Argiope bruennichi]
MANPKYADLPGIAHDQPDVYETSDLPEAEQGNLSISDAMVDQCDSVETLKVSPNEAFNKFKGKSLDGRNVDFTDGIGHGRKIGYDIRSGDWEMIGDHSKEKENPLQAYNRIQFEVKQLFEQVSEMKESSTKENKSSQVPPVVLVQQIEQLQKELQDLHLEKVLGSEALEEMSDPLGALHKKLLTQLETFKNVPVTDKKPKAATTTPTEEAVKYELYVRPDQAKLEQASKVANLEQRLRNLENIIGPDTKKLSFLTSNTDGKSVNAAINLLSSKLNLLEPSYLDQVESRFAVLHQCMQQVSEKKHQIEDAEKQNKIAELYELAKKVDDLSTSLPQVVERLVSLKDLHEQALQFSKALTQLDTTQQQITSALKNNEKLLKEVQGTFLKNSEMIETNIANINSRVAALQ